MTTHPISLRLVSNSVAFALAALAADVALARDTVLDAACTPLLTQQQRRLYDQANAGVDALHRFVFIRHAILQVDVYQTATWAESLNAARAACSLKR